MKTMHNYTTQHTHAIGYCTLMAILSYVRRDVRTHVTYIEQYHDNKESYVRKCDCHYAQI